MKRILDEMWEEQASESWEKLILVLGQIPILVAPNPQYQFRVGIDASQYGVGAVLYQVDDNGVTHIIALGAKKLSDRQSRYPALKRELLAVVFALKK